MKQYKNELIINKNKQMFVENKKMNQIKKDRRRKNTSTVKKIQKNLRLIWRTQ
ncbi:hypothetical protein TTHERM_001346837 (macronuclear) [Tetrahymena thermophila SB210]|uniref:Uncharacterized protein n=1 Tax=Tetrahymena thermophila (strain SB210) TaxID=312017 RepID=W7X154_TETTS|nr:hypothetical protein TTHERM_001346837 [Tetrahymena thermophila SB210]EWS72935.1 hypothetical protein TTHERM_001346837 [Tetrahymena thermophila SB210]|eukprot:XP_012654530.1 hypothetical protein TTHERM_001346837 [Tetrahymena thermophila SB210]